MENYKILKISYR